MRELTIIIVNFNTGEVIKQCLDSLFANYLPKLKSGKYQIIVVDNASTDNSLNYIKNNFSRVKIIANKVNVGFAKANNQGIKKSNSKYVLLLNPDTVVNQTTLVALINYLNKNPSVGIITCKVLLATGQLDDACHRGFPTPWRALTHFLGLGSIFPKSLFFNGYHLGYQNIDKVHEIDACVGAFLLIRRAVGNEVSWLDEDYFWYGEDLDLCFRVKQAGFKVVFFPEVTVIHYKGVASGIKKASRYLSQANNQTRIKATKARFEAMRIFYRKHYQGIYPRWLTGLVLVGINLKQKITEAYL